VFTDELINKTEQDWPSKIEENIENCDLFVVLLSPTSKKATYVRNEIEYALTHRRSIECILIRRDKKSSVPVSLASHQITNRVNEFEHLYAKKLLKQTKKLTKS
jgi:hypothetical protein